MIAEELINQMIPPLKLTDKVQKAIHWMEEMRVNQLPVVDNETYKGLVSEEVIYQNNDENASIGDLELICQNVYIMYYQHFFDILRTASSYDIQVIAVIGEEGNFLGVVTINDIVNAFANSAFMQEPGGILVLLMENRDYSLTEISRLVESNNAKILSAYVSEDKYDNSQLRVTLKINSTNLDRILATFERFEYKIIAKFHTVENRDFEKERIDMLFKYLDI